MQDKKNSECNFRNAINELMCIIGESKSGATAEERQLLDMAIMMLLGPNKSQFCIICPDPIKKLVENINGSGGLLAILSKVQRTRTNVTLLRVA